MTIADTGLKQLALEAYHEARRREKEMAAESRRLQERSLVAAVGAITGRSELAVRWETDRNENPLATIDGIKFRRIFTELEAFVVQCPDCQADMTRYRQWQRVTSLDDLGRLVRNALCMDCFREDRG